jgi:outer membrane biosynthesis protein TonB
MILLIILMFISGMTYLDPPPETGIAVNFGTSNVGRGRIQPQQNQPPKPVKQETKVEPVSKPEVKDKVLTQDNEEAPVIKEKTPKTKPKPSTKPKKTKPKPKPQPDKSITDILNNVKNAPGDNTNNSSGEGNDNQAGDKGQTSGDPNASSYYGNGGKNGGGGTGNYRLGNRNALTKPKPQFNCNEEGRVVVKIYVDKSGRVIQAIPGMKGSTNNAPCLLNAAKEAALRTKWSPDAKAPEKQIGKIIYNFKVTE